MVAEEKKDSWEKASVCASCDEGHVLGGRRLEFCKIATIFFWLTCEYHWQPLRFIVSMFPMFYGGQRKHF